MVLVNAMGLACPQPVILAKKEIDAGNGNFVVAVDNDIAVKNLEKLAQSQNFTTSCETVEGGFHVTFSGDACACAAAVEDDKKQPNNWALFVNKDSIGTNVGDLGPSLITMFFYTLCESNDPPRYILFMNEGVKLPAENEQIADHLKTLQEKGSEVLVCGTCLKFYGIADKLMTGNVSNMYDISERMHAADKVITL